MPSIRVVEPDAVPVHRRRLVERVRELDRDLGALRDLQQRARVLAVEREHRERPSLERTPHDAGCETQRVAARQADELSRARQRKAVGVRRSGQIWRRVRPQASSRQEAWRSPPAWGPWTNRANPRLRARGAREAAESSRVAPSTNCMKSGGWRRVLGDIPRSNSRPRMLRGAGRRFGRDEDDELVERDGGQHGASVVDDAEPLDDVHGRRGDPRDEDRITPERCGAREATERDRRGVAQMAVGARVHGERSCGSAELDASRARTERRRRERARCSRGRDSARAASRRPLQKVD